ncbi:ATP synthase subunit a [Clostridia bacterium]|nr:ATP synthase subunit a [Clostridia bacterium]
MEIAGAKILCEIPSVIPVLGGVRITQTTVVGWGVVLFLISLVWFFTSRVEKVPRGKQVLAEMFVEFIYGQVESVAGKRSLGIAPYIGTIFLMSITSSLSSLGGWRPPTTNFNTTLAWGLVTFCLIAATKIKAHGFFGHFKEYLNPLNILETVTLPITMALRHFCNILSDYIVMELVGGFLVWVSSKLFGVFGSYFPVFKVGIPAVLSVYFDIFGSLVQAFVFIMLTMVFVGLASEKKEEHENI